MRDGRDPRVRALLSFYQCSPNLPDAQASVITTCELRDSSTQLDFNTPRADQFAVTGGWRKNGQLFWRELFFAVIAAGDFVHPRIWSRSCGGIR